MDVQGYIANQKRLITHWMESSITRSFHLIEIFKEFRIVTDIWTEGIRSCIEGSQYDPEKFTRELDEVKNRSHCESAHCKDCPGPVRCHLFLVFFTGLMNLRNLVTKSRSWNSPSVAAVNDLTSKAMAVIAELMRRIPIDWSPIAKLLIEVENSLWCCTNLWSREGYKGEQSIAYFHKRMERAATLLVDNLLAALLQSKYSSISDFLAPTNRFEEPEGQEGDPWARLRSELEEYSENWKGDLDVVRISASLLMVILKMNSELNVNTQLHFDEIKTCIKDIDRRRCQRCDKDDDVCSSTKDLKNIADSLMGLIPEEEGNRITKMDITPLLDPKGHLEEYLRNMYRKNLLRRARLFYSCRSIDALLFDWESDALKCIVEDRGNLLNQLDKVSYPMFEMECSLRRRFEPKGVPMRNWTLNRSIKAVTNAESISATTTATNLSVFFALLYPGLYVFDVGSDINVAVVHYMNSNLWYCILTVLFTICPFLAEIINRFLSSDSAGGGSSTSRKTFFLESLWLFPRSVNSAIFAVKSRKEYPKEVNKLYAELLTLKGFTVIKKKALEKNEHTWIESPHLIQAMYFSAFVENEKYLSSWKLMDMLTESAPQLLLQLYTLFNDIFLSNPIGYIRWFGVVMSFLNVCFTLHSCHYITHYEDLNNNFIFSHRILDILQNFFITSSRFLAVSLMSTLNPYIFFPVSFCYNLCLYFLWQLCYLSESRTNGETCRQSEPGYRKMLEGRRMSLLPLYRLFVPLSLISPWRMEGFDDVLFHLETMVMTILWFALFPRVYPSHDWRLILYSVIFVMECLVVPILCINFKLHSPAKNCGSGKRISELIKLDYEDGGDVPIG